MKCFYKIVLSLSLVLVAFVASAIPGVRSGHNEKDATGHRQGYWIITGEMISDRQFPPQATVEEGMYKDDRREGLWKKYWPNGKLRSEITYTSGKPLGPYRVYYQSGQMEELGFWDDGKNTGEFKRFYSNGNMNQHFYFGTNGKRNGIQYYFHENGRPALVVEISNGMESGSMKRYNEDGELIEEKIFENGKIRKVVSSKTEPLKEDIVKADPHNPAIGKEATKAIGIPNEAQGFKANGFNTLYDANGNIVQSGEFRNGKLHSGKWYRYNSSGILTKIDLYQKGRYIGEGIQDEK
jgi:antitoxin component YwqK of YwqJK toxin-antitoxin module